MTGNSPGAREQIASKIGGHWEAPPNLAVLPRIACCYFWWPAESAANRCGAVPTTANACVALRPLQGLIFPGGKNKGCFGFEETLDELVAFFDGVGRSLSPCPGQRLGYILVTASHVG